MNALPEDRRTADGPDKPDTPGTPGTSPAAGIAEAPTGAPRPRDARRGPALMLLLTAAGAALLLWAARATWAQGTVDGAGGARLSASGQEVSSAPAALALVGLAAAVAVFAVRRAGRIAVGTLLALAGAGAAAAAALGARDTAALDEKAARSAALTNATAAHVTHTAWPWLAAAGGSLLCAAGVLTLLRGRDWPTMSSRYDAPAAPTRTGRRPAQTPTDLWKALDRGEDPTAD